MRAFCCAAGVRIAKCLTHSRTVLMLGGLPSRSINVAGWSQGMLSIGNSPFGDRSNCADFCRRFGNVLVLMPVAEEARDSKPWWVSCTVTFLENNRLQHPFHLLADIVCG